MTKTELADNPSSSASGNEIILYQPDETLKLDVRLEDDTVWLTQAQMAQLFNTTKQNISLHINNAIREGEIMTDSVVKEYLTTAADGKTYRTKYYNLDVIISVGYRVKSLRGVQFRRWATLIIKSHMLRGYSLSQHISSLEDRIDRRLAEHDIKLSELTGRVDFIVKTALPPVEGVFFNGQIFDAYTLVADIIRTAAKRIVLIDNYIDDKVLKQLDKRSEGVTATIYTPANRTTRQDIDAHNRQYPAIKLVDYRKAHDRFLIIDETVYHIGASLKDLGRKLFAFSRMDVMSGSELISRL